MRRLAAVVAAAALALGGCGNAVYVGTDEGDPAVDGFRCVQPTGPSGMLVLIAQSIPAAQYVPCLRDEPGLWTMSQLEVRDGAATIGFGYQFGGPDKATIEMRPSCDTHAAKEVSSQHAGTQRYNRDLVRGGRYANEIYFVYEGACTVLRFDLAATGAELRGAEFAGSLGFVARDELDRQIRAATDDRLTLDPAG